MLWFTPRKFKHLKIELYNFVWIKHRASSFFFVGSSTFSAVPVRQSCRTNTQLMDTCSPLLASLWRSFHPHYSPNHWTSWFQLCPNVKTLSLLSPHQNDKHEGFVITFPWSFGMRLSYPRGSQPKRIPEFTCGSCDWTLSWKCPQKKVQGIHTQFLSTSSSELFSRSLYLKKPVTTGPQTGFPILQKPPSLEVWLPPWVATVHINRKQR